MAERGNTTHGPGLDDKMKQETQKVVQGNQPAHAEQWREAEPFPDDTDPEEVQQALKPPAEQERDQKSGESGQ
ncbi:hypothetical protein V1638_07460 [Pseudarthrobacter sp. J64]|uniref:hypothetical protein n=1 Tax=Pseudarthrobacter sp. J64 TaxID=3116485 RepID=UPI002E818BD5|nr:hypothetical protein [Pseudarthrobacter sp. J64]MEE2569237.1 hypothetical protein [Pseudarthrobacter sp. J64]